VGGTLVGGTLVGGALRGGALVGGTLGYTLPSRGRIGQPRASCYMPGYPVNQTSPPSKSNSYPENQSIHSVNQTVNKYASNSIIEKKIENLTQN